jgi:hypothetical protein
VACTRSTASGSRRGRAIDELGGFKNLAPRGPIAAVTRGGDRGRGKLRECRGVDAIPARSVYFTFGTLTAPLRFLKGLAT